MTDQLRTMGIDGCRAGWLAICLDEGRESHHLIRTPGDLAAFFYASDVTLIDVPIGLSDDSSTRMCDDLLRRILGPEYRSSVFSPPVRDALMFDDYKAACDLNKQRSGKRFSIQAWNIVPKIRTVDTILQQEKQLQGSVFESHPELLFKKLNRGGPLLPKKKTKEGIEARRTLLSGVSEKAAEIEEEIRAKFRKSEVKDDDILDALVLAHAAAQTSQKPLRSLPIPPEKDRTGLGMAIHFV